MCYGCCHPTDVCRDTMGNYRVLALMGAFYKVAFYLPAGTATEWLSHSVLNFLSVSCWTTPAFKCRSDQLQHLLMDSLLSPNVDEANFHIWWLLENVQGTLKWSKSIILKVKADLRRTRYIALSYSIELVTSFLF